MNEHSLEFQPPVDLPKPQPEQTSGQAETGVVRPSGETAPAQQLEHGVSASPVSSGFQPAVSQGSVGSPSGAITDDSSHRLAVQTPPIADDTDLIEKEWVNKAKEIVERTKTDPYNQNKQMSRVKADYLKKRYNKDVKLTD